MLGFLIFLGWLLVFCSPVAISIISAAREKEVSFWRWFFDVVWAIGGGITILCIIKVLGIWTNVLWFQELGYSERFWMVFWAKIKYFFLGTIITFIFFWLNSRLSRINFRVDKDNKDERITVSVSFLAMSFVALLIATVFGAAASWYWEKWLLYNNQVPFGVSDPIFGKDVAFYIFSMPVFGFLRTASILAILIGIVIAGVSYAIQNYILEERDSRDNQKEKDSIILRALTHIAVLCALLIGTFIFSTQLGIWNLLYSTRGAVFGAGYTDVNVQVGAYKFLMVAFSISIVILLIAAIARSTKGTIFIGSAGLTLCVLTWLIGGIIYPAIVQRFSVEPNELAKETEYIKHNIAFTRQAYGLTSCLKESEFPVNPQIDQKTVAENRTTLDSIRLWDWRILQKTNSQRQIFRNYYAFPDVDITRYNINGKICQIMQSGRELNSAAVSRGWPNERLIFTHGFGACANPVNTFTDEGLPDYWLKDIPPTAKYPELEIKEPRIYFGEMTQGHIYVKTKQQEFDYPKGDENTTYTYDGPAGVELSSGLRKLAFALRFDGMRLLTLQGASPKSRIMFHRDIFSRVESLAPFLKLDQDPYQVVADGKLWFLWDAYTTIKGYPYSEPHPGLVNSDTNIHNYLAGLNYVRNSVKIAINAFTGEVSFFVFDEKDPLIKAYQKIFPSMFKAAAEMPASLRQHIRYPEDLITIQCDILANYHMTDPVVFYNREDAWDVAKESTGNEVRRIIPYYVVMRIGEEAKEEFVQILPFTPRSMDPENPRSNMVAWVAGRCDGEHYGELILYKFPKDYLVIGPLQMGARINQDDIISKDFTLWNQQGSSVHTGNLLVIPLSGYRLLYVQPVYLEATANQMPELKRIIVASGEQLAYEDTFEKALTSLVNMNTVGNNVEIVSGGSQEDLIKEAVQHLDSYQKLTGQGKFTEAGREMQALTNTLNSLLPK